MKVSIITICLNARAHIEQAIQSVIAQTYADIEYIIIDGASTDGTQEVVHQYADHIATFVSEPDGSSIVALNKGIQRATGDWIYFLCSDDYLFDERVIEDVVAFIQANPCDFLYGNHEARFPNGDRSVYEPAPPDQMLEEMITLDRTFIQPESFFKTDVFQKVGLFNPHFDISADYDWFVRLFQDDSLTIRHMPRTIVSYAQTGRSSDIRAVFAEVFDIQSKAPVYQSDYWLRKRIEKLQRSFVDRYDEVQKLRYDQSQRTQNEDLHTRVNQLTQKVQQLTQKIQALETGLQAERDRANHAEGEIEAMKTSKFWQIRTAWFRVKKSLGLPTD